MDDQLRERDRDGAALGLSVSLRCPTVSQRDERRNREKRNRKKKNRRENHVARPWTRRRCVMALKRAGPNQHGGRGAFVFSVGERRWEMGGAM